eukprot:g16418.t1
MTAVKDPQGFTTRMKDLLWKDWENPKKHLMRQQIFNDGEAEAEYEKLLAWENQQEFNGLPEASGESSPKPETILADGRIAALGGGRVGSRRFGAVSTKVNEIKGLAGRVLSGQGTRSGSMRVEVSYSVTTGESLGCGIAAAIRDNFREVVGYDDHGWSSLTASFFAVPSADIALLAKANIDRSAAAIEAGLDAGGEALGEALPLGLLPSDGEVLLQLEGKAFRRVVIGRMLLDGLRRFGFVGLLEEDLENLSSPGASSPVEDSPPPGVLIGFGGGRRKEVFLPGVRPVLKEFGLRIPRVGGSAELLTDDGADLLGLLRKIV